MLAILSPAKTLDLDSPLPKVTPTQPAFLEEADRIARDLGLLSQDELAELLEVSENLAELNHERYQRWEHGHNDETARPAIFTFAGDVYDGLDVAQFDDEDIEAAQERLRILSGLYGVLRPLDYMQPYRLEMGTKYEPPGSDERLVDDWRPRVTRQLEKDLKAGDHAALVNLASNEYASAVDFSDLSKPVIEVAFKEETDGELRIIAVYAKKARGLFARWMVQQRADSPGALRDFDLDGYTFDEANSSDEELVFSRPKPEPKS